MKKPVMIAACVLAVSCSVGERRGVIIPAPQSVELTGGMTRIGDTLRFVSNLGRDANTPLCGVLDRAQIPYRMGPRTGGTLLELELLDLGRIPAEGYQMEIAPGRIVIRASDEGGLFYGLQSFVQLAEYHGDKIPSQTIGDAPRFPYRGLMLDVSRHFSGVDFVKKQLDAMARYKLNRFHWHLVDGAGWRLEIKKYPLLTQVAAWRPYETWDEWSRNGKEYCHYSDPRARGGFYTAQDIKEVVDYAKSLHIEVIPEIDMPGHSLEVTTVYPELGCTGRPNDTWELCIGNEKTFEFVTDVLAEVMEMFPSRYIHIGGDEASRGNWKRCPKCQARIRDEKLGDEDGLQSYMIRRVGEFVNTHGREIIGWDEILDGGVAPNAIVMAWRGTESGIRAAEMGRDVVMTPGSYCYLDYYQDAPPTQPVAMPITVPLKKVYSFDPAPDSLPAGVRDHILGVQGNLWREHIVTDEHAEYMIYPRLTAIAEVAWTQPENRNYDDFRLRALRNVEWLLENGYNPFDLASEVGDRPQATVPWDNKAKHKPVTYITPYHAKYPAAGDATLTDGLRGGWSYGDGRWQGFLDAGFEVMIDLGEQTELKEIYAEFMQSYWAYIWVPSQVVISISADGERYDELKRQSTRLDPEDPKALFETFGWEGETTSRYIRIKADNNGRTGGWLFIDEIMVR